MTKKCHFIGIGGIGMSGLARILLSQKVEVSGSDLASSYMTESIEKAGAKVYIGHSYQHILPDMTVIFSSDIKKDNPEYAAALALKCPLLHRSDLLAELMKGYKTLAVAGTHGKTTTSALLTSVLIKASLDPAYAVGGVLPQLQANAGHGFGPYFVAEADESDGTFLKYSPFGAIVTNIDKDHLDYYKTEDGLQKAFQTFMEKVSCHLFWCGDDPNLKSSKGTSYGFSKGCALQIKNFRQDRWNIYFDIVFKDKEYKDIELALTGKHNALNASAVFGLLLSLGVEEKIIKEAFREFKGVFRRTEQKGEVGEVLLLDDYAHHPTEIKATLKAVREAIKERRLFVVYQPHRYSRTRDCLNLYSDIFDEADHLILTEIYGAGETPIDGITSARLLDQIHFPSKNIVERKKVAAYLSEMVRPFDVVISLGAGDITKLSKELLDILSQKPPRKIRLGVIFGGNSVEYEISLLSAKNILSSLDPKIFDTVHFGITKDGFWTTDPLAKALLENKIVKAPSQKISPAILEKLEQCDVLFPVLHGKFGEDGTIQGFFEMLGKPYVGCDHRSAAISMDKALTKKLMVLNGISTSPFVDFSYNDWLEGRDLLLEQIKWQLRLPVFVKAVHLGSSIGLVKVEDFSDLSAAIAHAFKFDDYLLVENGIQGREIEFALLGNRFVTAFPPGEVLTQGKVYTFDAKYGPQSTKTTAQATLSKELVQEGCDLAKMAYKAVGCTGMARIDFFLDNDNKFWLNEINPIPGFTSISLYPKMCEQGGLYPKDLINHLVILAFHRQTQISQMADQME